MDRALAIAGLGISAVSIFPTSELSDTTRYVIGYLGLLMAAVGFAMMAWERRAPAVSRVRGWLGRGPVDVIAPASLPEFVPLYEVALQAYERTRSSFMARSAEQLGASGPVGWYAQLIETEIALYGRRPPSRIIERFDEPGFYLEADGVQIVAKRPWSEDRWEDISIRADEMPRTLSFVEERAAVLDK